MMNVQYSIKNTIRNTFLLIMLTGMLPLCNGNGNHKTEPPPAKKASLKEGKELWTKHKPGPGYAYIYRDFTVMGMHRHITLIVVKDNRVVKRIAKVLVPDKKDKHQLVVDRSVIQNQAELSQKLSWAAPAITMDQMYTECEKLLAQPGMTGKLLITDSGTIRLCSVRPPNCADDCSVSYGTTYFTGTIPGEDWMQDFASNLNENF